MFCDRQVLESAEQSLGSTQAAFVYIDSICQQVI